MSADADWVVALEHGGSPSTVTFSDPGKNTYVAVQGSTRAVEDRTRTSALWNPGAAAYFDAEDDSQVRVLDVAVHHGEHWDGPHGRIGSLLQVASAAIGRDNEDVGTKGDIVVEGCGRLPRVHGSIHRSVSPVQAWADAARRCRRARPGGAG